MWLKRKLGAKYTCKICLDFYPLEHPNQTICSDECRRININRLAKQFRDRDQERRREIERRNRLNNPETQRKAQKKYADKNKDKISKYKKEYYLKKKELMKNDK